VKNLNNAVLSPQSRLVEGNDFTSLGYEKGQSAHTPDGHHYDNMETMVPATQVNDGPLGQTSSHPTAFEPPIQAASGMNASTAMDHDDAQHQQSADGNAEGENHPQSKLGIKNQLTMSQDTS